VTTIKPTHGINVFEKQVKTSNIHPSQTLH